MPVCPSHSTNHKLPASDLPPTHAMGWSRIAEDPAFHPSWRRNLKQVPKELVSLWLCRAPGIEIKDFLFLPRVSVSLTLPYFALPRAPSSTAWLPTLALPLEMRRAPRGSPAPASWVRCTRAHTCIQKSTQHAAAVRYYYCHRRPASPSAPQT